jgi:virginiamycin B lyase
MPTRPGTCRILMIGVALFVSACARTPVASAPSTSTPSGTPIATEADRSPSPAPTVDLPETVTINDVPGVITIDDVDQPDWIQLVDGTAWAAGVAGGVGRFDRESAQLTDTVKVPGTICLAMTVAFHSLWAANCDAGAVIRIDPRTRRVTATIELKGRMPAPESSIAACPNLVWILTSGRENALVSIDPKANAIVGAFHPPEEPAALICGLGGLWLSTERGSVSHLDPRSGELLADIAVGDHPRFMAIGDGSLWVLNQGDATVSRIDPTTDRVIATIAVGREAIDGGDLAYGGGSVWARVTDALVARIEPATNSVAGRYGPHAGSGSVAADDRALWISAHDIHTVWRVPLG